MHKHQSPDHLLESGRGYTLALPIFHPVQAVQSCVQLPYSAMAFRICWSMDLQDASFDCAKLIKDIPNPFRVPRASDEARVA
jgi:hypothetical protein